MDIAALPLPMQILLPLLALASMAIPLAAFWLISQIMEHDGTPLQRVVAWCREPWFQW